MSEPILESVRQMPAPCLGGAIAAYEGYRQRGAAPAVHLGLTSPFLTVIITLDEPLELRSVGRFTTLVGGLHSTPVHIVHAGAQSGIQLSLSPLASRALLGLPAGELAGLDLPGDTVLGPAAGRLWEQLGSAADWSECFAVLDRTLASRLSRRAPVAMGPPAPVNAAWNLLRATGGQIPVSALAHEVGWSPRQLEKAFGREIGMSPKRAARVIRFDRTRRALQSRARIASGALDLARLAADHGYHDQPHLIRDFHAFTGLAPTAWLSQEFGNVQVGEPGAP